MKKRIKTLSAILAIFMIVQITFPTVSSAVEQIKNNVEQNNYYYISDLDYITENNWSYVGYGNIMKDKNIDGGIISLLIDGTRVYFTKGMGAHASSQLTYDISEYSDIYTRFVAKLGIDSSMNGKGEVCFKITASNDGIEWIELYKSDPITSSQNALEVDINIENYKYLRLSSDKNGANANDHSVYADARIVKEDYDISSELYQGIQKISYYDELLSKNTPEENYENHLDLVLKREFVNRIGYWTLQNSIKDDTTGDMKEAIDWLLNDENALQLFIETGNIGDSLKCLNSLKILYKNYKDILNDKENGLVYKKMLIALAISYSTDKIVSPLRFNSPEASYDISERYRIMKKLYDDNLFPNKEEFKNYSMELIRFVMNDSIDNSETEWLRGYSQFKYPDNLNQRLNPYSYMPYVSPNYNQDKLYDQNNYENYNNKYKLSEYNIPYGLNEDGTKTPRTWMVMEAGGICWNISRLGQNLHKVHGIPTVGVYQPGHEAYLTYSEDINGNGIWNIGNNISGWGQSCTTWYGGNRYRLLFNWNNKYFTNMHMNNTQVGNNAGYQLLGQAALNNYDNYQESFYYNLIANSYEELNKKEEIYNKSLEKLDINLDTYDNMINVYKNQENKTSEDWKQLAKKIIDVYTYYPMAMVDLLKIIEPYLNNDDIVEIDILKTAALNKATKATDKESLQANACKEIANALIGSNKVDLASFSFDGDNAGKIVINSKYDDYDFQIQYSLDGGKSWQATLEHQIMLSKEQLNNITAENDIKVKISGSNEIFTIDILNGENVSLDSLTINDEEDIFVGKTNNLEYSIDEGKNWQDYNNNIKFSETQTVKVRYKAYGTYLNGNIMDFEFTKDTNPETNKYVSIKNIKFVSAGISQNGYAPENMIDASPFTSWHTKYGQIADDKSYIVSFDKVKYLSQITYDPAGLNGRIKSAKIYVSLDGEEWKLVAENTNLANDENRKVIKLSESMPAKYVKIEANETYGNAEGPNKYVSGKRFNYYEDLTKEYKEPVIEYSINSLTNKDVIATLQLPAGFTAIGDTTHIFKNNGEYIFKYRDINNKEKTIKAEVNWIDKEAPTATVQYDITETTKFVVKATLKDFSEENVTILNADEDGSHTFVENGEFIFEIQDQAGNIGYVKAVVTWIENNEDTQVEELYVKTNIYQIKENIISSIEANTTINEFMSNIQTNAKSIKILKDGKQVDIISTGSTMILNDEVSYTLVVNSDINGNGNIDIADLSMINKHLIESSIIEDEFKQLAPDVNEDGKISILDLSILNKKIIK